MADATSDLAVPAKAGRDHRFYLTAWRWHFYAGLYVVPFLVMLAVTGLIMLWIAAITDLNGERTRVAVSGTPLPVTAQAAAAAAAVPDGSAVQYIAPRAPDRVAVFRVDAGEAATTVLVDPYSGAVTTTFPWRGGWYDLANDIHGSLLLGTLGDRLIEIAASLGVVLLATGLYLHWPRGGSGWASALVPDITARGRALWKSLHGTVGFWAAGLMLVFLVSGLSWSGIWGERFVQAWSTFPAEKWDAVPLSDERHASMNHAAAKEVPWALEQTPLPLSGSRAGTVAVPMPVTFDGVDAFARQLGFVGRYQINLPATDDGVWTISHDSMSNDGHDPWRDRTLHIDRFTGRVLVDVGYADYSAYARAMAWGVAFHEGDLGVWNLALNTLFCAAMILMPVSGVVLWWKRRPERAGRVGAPPRTADVPLWKGAVVLMVVIGALFPMAGATLLVVLALDWLVLRRWPAMRRRLS